MEFYMGIDYEMNILDILVPVDEEALEISK